MKNLMKSASCGNSAKFVWEVGGNNSNEYVNNTLKTLDYDDISNIGKTYNSPKNFPKDLDVDEDFIKKFDLMGKDPIFENFNYSCTANKETIAVLKNRNIKFEGSKIFAGKTEIFDFSKIGTKSLQISAENNIIDITILKENTEFTDWISITDKEAIMNGAVIATFEENEKKKETVKLSDVIFVERIVGGEDNFKDFDIPNKEEFTAVLKEASSKGYFMVPGSTRSKDLNIFDSELNIIGNVTTSFRNFSNTEHYWLREAIHILKIDMVK